MKILLWGGHIMESSLVSHRVKKVTYCDGEKPTASIYTVNYGDAPSSGMVILTYDACSNCEYLVPREANFCGNCGCKLV